MTTEVTKETATAEVTTVAETPAVTIEAPQSDILSSLSEDLRSVKSLEKFKGKDVNELAKSYTNLESLIGKKVSELPEDVVKQFLKVPSAPDKYILADEAKDYVNEKLLEVAHKSNLSQDQLKAITDTIVELKRAETQTAESEATSILESRKEELKKEFGVALDQRLAAVKKVMTQFGDAELESHLAKTGLLHDVKFVKFLDNITQQALSVKMVGADYAAQYTPTPEEAKALIQKKYADTEFSNAYFNQFHPGHKVAVAEMNKLVDLTANA